MIISLIKREVIQTHLALVEKVIAPFVKLWLTTSFGK